MKRLALIAALSLPSSAFAGVEGYWKTIDDETGNPRSLVHIQLEAGVLTGTVVQLYRQPDEDRDPLCNECEPPLNTKHIVGMRIIDGLRLEDDTWEDGTILDPGNGSVYKCYISEQNGKLEVRGYIGISFLGRTQVWHPATAPDPAIRTYLLDPQGDAMPLSFTDGHQASEEEIAEHLK